MVSGTLCSTQSRRAAGMRLTGIAEDVTHLVRRVMKEEAVNGESENSGDGMR